jgi:ABC-type uncharacterized transport system substrate-binding protein
MMFRWLFAVAISVGAMVPAWAHPHVWVTARSEIQHDASGAVAAIRQIWTFDDMFSTMATTGLDTNGDKAFSREELAPLAKINVESLRDFDYFTVVKMGQERQALQPPVDYWLEFKDNLLTLTFTLPLVSPRKLSAQQLSVSIYDPSYFVDFSMAPENPVAMTAAPQGCALTVHSAADPDPSLADKLQIDEFAMAQPGIGAQFANRIMVSCP